MPFSIGIDVGGTKVLGGIVDENGVIVTRKLKETPREGGAALTKVIGDVALELLAEQEVEGIGISAAGFISADRKTIVATPNIAGWNGVNLADQLSDRLQRRVVLENDANAAAWGEFRHGAGLGLARVQRRESTVHEDDIGEASGRSLGERRRCNQRQEAAKDRATGAGHHRAGRHGAAARVAGDD